MGTRWLHLFAIDGDGRIAFRYAGKLEWVPVDRTTARNMKLVA
jgi:hypothetical protein